MGSIKTKNDSSGMKLGDYYSSAKRQNLFVGADGFADTETGGIDPQEVEEMIDEYIEVHREEFQTIVEKVVEFSSDQLTTATYLEGPNSKVLYAYAKDKLDSRNRIYHVGLLWTDYGVYAHVLDLNNQTVTSRAVTIRYGLVEEG